MGNASAATRETGVKVGESLKASRADTRQSGNSAQNDLNFDWKHPNYEPIFLARIKALENLRANPALIPGVKEYYKTDPVQFINDWGVTFDPRNAEIGLPTTMPFVLFPKQEQYINWLYDRWKQREDGLAEKSRDMGVSWLCVAFGVWMWLFHPGAVIGFGSRKEEYVDKIGDPKSLFWKVRQFIAWLPAEFRPVGYEEKKHAAYMRILNPENDSAIVGEAGDNIGRGNRTSIYFKDESAFYDHAAAIDAALSQTSNCKIDVSTPNGAGNPFYQKRHSGKINVFVFDWRDDPRKDDEWYRKQCELHDPVIIAQEIDRNYEASVTDAFIPSELVDGAMSRGPADTPPAGNIRIGVDVARFGDDKTVIAIRRGRVLLKLVTIEKLDLMAVAQRVRVEASAYGTPIEQIAVDTIGVGAGVADILRSWYPDKIDRATHRTKKLVVDVNSSIRQSDGQYYNLRAYMWGEMKEWLKTASLPRDQDLRVDLTALRYKFKGNELLIESKIEAKARGIKSPDRADALAMTFAIPSLPERPQAGARARPFTNHDPSMGMLG